MQAPHHFSAAAGPVEHMLRRLYSGTLTSLGFAQHVVRAQGARFRVDVTDYVDQQIAHFGIWEEEQIEDLAAVASSRTVEAFLDIGANTGFYSIMFAMKRLAPRVIAFEPDPGNFARLKTNLALNGLDRIVEAVPVALGDANSEVTLYEGAKYNRGESTIAVPEQTPQEVTFRVRQTRLDDAYAFQQKNLIFKIDVEGYEFQVIAGMERTLRDNLCYLQIEHYGELHEALKAQMAAFGYRYRHTVGIDLYFTNMPDVR